SEIEIGQVEEHTFDLVGPWPRQLSSKDGGKALLGNRRCQLREKIRRCRRSVLHQINDDWPGGQTGAKVARLSMPELRRWNTMYANLLVLSRVFESAVIGARIDNQQLGV